MQCFLIQLPKRRFASDQMSIICASPLELLQRYLQNFHRLMQVERLFSKDEGKRKKEKKKKKLLEEYDYEAVGIPFWALLPYEVICNSFFTNVEIQVPYWLAVKSSNAHVCIVPISLELTLPNILQLATQSQIYL